MAFEWHASKSAKNRQKHGVTFEEAVTVFGDRAALTVPDVAHSDDEDRELTIGTSDRGRVLVVSHTKREQAIRIISARKATRVEREDYEENIRQNPPQ